MTIVSSRIPRLGAALCAVALLGLVVPAAAAPERADERARWDRAEERGAETRPANGRLREEVERREQGRGRGRDVQYADGRIVVEVLHDLDRRSIRRVVREHGGRVTGEVRGRLVSAEVPWQELEGLEAENGVRYLRPPLEASVIPPGPELPAGGGSGSSTTNDHGSIVGEEVAKTNADDWHAAGFTGAGIRIGIIDVFGESSWSDARAAGEVPPPADTFCRAGGSSCDVFTVTPGAAHGTAVAEIVHEMAPDAELYLVFTATLSDYQAAIDWLDSRGVDVITRSLGSEYDGPGDGTGPLAGVFAGAVEKGMTVFNAVGNAAGRDGLVGLHWRGPWKDANGNDTLEFSGSDEGLGFSCGFTFGVRWDDWVSSNPTDYDVVITDSDLNIVAESRNRQTSGAPPLEDVDLDCGSLPSSLRLFVDLHQAGDGTSDDVIQLQMGRPIEHWTNPYSATTPMAASASPGVLAVGAVDPPTGTEIADYSSEGPTNDERIKPDIAAQAGVDNFTFGRFSGTSASTPAAAGAAALVIQAGEASTPDGVKSYLQDEAVVDRGTVGADNLYGAGELVLGSPPGGTASGADLAVTIDGSPDPVPPSQPVAYGVPVQNLGPETAENILVTVDLPPEVAVESAAGTGFACTLPSTGAEVRCITESLVPGASTVIDVAGRVSPDAVPGTLGATAAVSSDTADPISSNDSDTDATSVDCDIVGTSAADELNGTPGAEVICGLGGDDTIRGGGGDDLLVGGAGDDQIAGNTGYDEIHGGSGGEILLHGGAGDDVIFGGLGDESNRPGGGPVLVGGRGDDVLDGGEGDDFGQGNGGSDVLSGGPGRDRLAGNIGSDRIFGDDGDDLLLHGGAGNDIVRGGPGDDQRVSDGRRLPVVIAGSGIDNLFGDDGNDTLHGGTGGDRLRGGPDHDRCIIDADDVLVGGCEV